MLKTLQVSRVPVLSGITAVCFLGAAFALGSMIDRQRALAQQPDKIAASAKATPTPTPAPSLKLTQEEVNAASPLWNELQSQQREYTVAIGNLRKAAKKPNDREGHSLAVLALAAVLENADTAQGKWNEWMTKAQADHECKDCEINLQKWEFIKFPTAANTASK